MFSFSEPFTEATTSVSRAHSTVSWPMRAACAASAVPHAPPPSRTAKQWMKENHLHGHNVACIHELTYNALPDGGAMPAMRDKTQACAGAVPRTPTVVMAEED